MATLLVRRQCKMSPLRNNVVLGLWPQATLLPRCLSPSMAVTIYTLLSNIILANPERNSHHNTAITHIDHQSVNTMYPLHQPSNNA